MMHSSFWVDAILIRQKYAFAFCAIMIQRLKIVICIVFFQEMCGIDYMYSEDDA